MSMVRRRSWGLKYHLPAELNHHSLDLLVVEEAGHLEHGEAQVLAVVRVQQEHDGQRSEAGGPSAEDVITGRAQRLVAVLWEGGRW